MILFNCYAYICPVTRTICRNRFLNKFTTIRPPNLWIATRPGRISHAFSQGVETDCLSTRFIYNNRNPENDAKIKVEKSWYKLYQFHASTCGNEYINAMKHFELVFWAYLKPSFLFQLILLIKWPIEGF